MRTPTPDNPWPDSTRARVQECVEQGVSDLPEGHNAVQFDLFVTPDGLVQEVRAKGETLAAHDVQICINQALKAMTVPAFVLERAASASNKQPVMMQSRELMGDVTVATGATMGGIWAGLEPMLVEAGPVGVAVIVGIFIVTAVVTWASDARARECEEQWKNAILQCVEWLSWQNPPRNFTGGHKIARKGTLTLIVVEIAPLAARLLVPVGGTDEQRFEIPAEEDQSADSRRGSDGHRGRAKAYRAIS